MDGGTKALTCSDCIYENWGPPGDPNWVAFGVFWLLVIGVCVWHWKWQRPREQARRAAMTKTERDLEDLTNFV